MSRDDEPKPTPEPSPPDPTSEAEPDDVPADAEDDGGPIAALLKRSLAAPGEDPSSSGATPFDPPAPPTDADRALLLGVQKKLRVRSKGKFYADGWSTTQSRVSYALVAIIMLVTIAAVYLALGPTGIH